MPLRYGSSCFNLSKLKFGLFISSFHTTHAFLILNVSADEMLKLTNYEVNFAESKNGYPTCKNFSSSFSSNLYAMSFLVKVLSEQMSGITFK